jgi:hypothetical protein
MKPMTASSESFISKPAARGTLAARLDTRILCDGGCNGVGQLTGHPVDDVIIRDLLTAAGAGERGANLDVPSVRRRPGWPGDDGQLQPGWAAGDRAPNFFI